MIRIESSPDQHGVGDAEVARRPGIAALAAADRLQLSNGRDGHAAEDISAGGSPVCCGLAPLPAVYLAAGEGRRLRPLTDDAPEGDARRRRRAARASARCEPARAPGWRRSWRSPGHAREALRRVGDLSPPSGSTRRFAEHGNVYSLWCARDVVRRGCYIVNSRRAVRGCDRAARWWRAHRLGCAVRVRPRRRRRVDEGRRRRRSAARRSARTRPSGPHPEYIGLARIDPAHGPALAADARALRARGAARRVLRGRDRRSWRAARRCGLVAVDGLAWIEIDDHEDLAQARDEVLARVA